MYKNLLYLRLMVEIFAIGKFTFFLCKYYSNFDRRKIYNLM